MRINQYQVILKKTGSFPAPDLSVYSSQSAAAAADSFLRYTHGGHLPDREVFGVLYLNTKRQVTGLEVISIGSLHSVIVEPRETFKGAILASADAIIAFHNHPSGHSEPSAEDLDITIRLSRAGNLLGIKLLDSLILGNTFTSLKEKGYY